MSYEQVCVGYREAVQRMNRAKQALSDAESVVVDRKIELDREKDRLIEATKALRRAADESDFMAGELADEGEAWAAMHP